MRLRSCQDYGLSTSTERVNGSAAHPARAKRRTEGLEGFDVLQSPKGTQCGPAFNSRQVHWQPPQGRDIGGHDD